MITRETSERIWLCYREIAAAEKLFEDMEEAKKEADRRGDKKYAERLSDAFGRKQNLQLGIPSGDNCHRLLDVAPDLAKTIIRVHIANKRAELFEANEQARIEIDLEVKEVVNDADQP